MFDAPSVSSLVSSFRDPSDGAALKSAELVLLLLECSPTPFSREHFTPGHVTCTGLVVDPAAERLLLVHHGRLDRWLLPGGHVEPGDGRIDLAARREVVEETSVELPEPDMPAPLVGIDVHGIPPKRGEPYHLHHDLIFAFRALSEDIQTSPESHAVAWCGPAEFDRYAVPGNVRRAWQRVLTFTKV
jgi:8-oxo-dGTP pyrophosphatase MutT (NUDIX family)